MDNKFIMFAGASGVGKTTSAKYVEKSHEIMVDEELEETSSLIPFISGSVSDLIKNTKDMSHRDMLNRDSSTLQQEDWQIVNLRKKLFDKARGKGNFVCDRSFLDSAAYFLYKQADKIPQCEIGHFLTLCEQLTSLHCSHLILIDFTVDMLSKWVTEDNGKRITNNYFQMEISRIMKMVLDIWKVKWLNDITYIKQGKFFPQAKDLKYGAGRAVLESVYGTTQVLVLRECNLEIRERLIDNFINGKI